MSDGQKAKIYTGSGLGDVGVVGPKVLISGGEHNSEIIDNYVSALAAGR
jgi:hypothetical protein